MSTLVIFKKPSKENEKEKEKDIVEMLLTAEKRQESKKSG